ncbi:MAG: S4 domain-containing protein YaaA [Clostridiaceae bacterium]
MEKIKIKTEYIKLDSFLKFTGEVSQGSDAKIYILNGQVKVNGEIELRRGKKLRPNDIVDFNEKSFMVID